MYKTLPGFVSAYNFKSFWNYANFFFLRIFRKKSLGQKKDSETRKIQNLHFRNLKSLAGPTMIKTSTKLYLSTNNEGIEIFVFGLAPDP